jgi:EpsD family peptidyl-prolyl cis-trans isomerase
MPLDPDLHSSVARRVAVAAAVVVFAVALSACSKKEKDAAASQTAAKVNKEEITVHQINFYLAQQRGIPPAEAASAGKRILERLIDQELEVQKAVDQKLERDPRVVQQIEAARREVIAKAYVEKVGLGAPKPTAQEIQAYYDQHPNLFSARRIYRFQEVAVAAKPEQFDTVKAKAESSKNAAEFATWLQANGYRFQTNEAQRNAEQIPMGNLDRIAALKDGQSLIQQTSAGATVLYLAASKSEPVDLQRATAAIEQFLLNDRRRKLLEDDRIALRAGAKIEYVGTYADGAPKPIDPASLSASGPPLTTIAPNLDPAASAAPQIEVAPVTTGAASMPSSATLEKGLQGMK